MADCGTDQSGRRSELVQHHGRLVSIACTVWPPNRTTSGNGSAPAGRSCAHRTIIVFDPPMEVLKIPYGEYTSAGFSKRCSIGSIPCSPDEAYEHVDPLQRTLNVTQLLCVSQEVFGARLYPARIASCSVMYLPLRVVP